MRTVKHKTIRNVYRQEDLGNGIRGKYYKGYQKGTNLVLLSPDVTAAFPDEASVNDALRTLMKIARQSVGPTKRSTKSRLTSRSQ